MRIAVRLLDPRLTAWGFPRRGSADSAGLDLFACIDSRLVLEPQAPATLIPTGLVVMIRDPEWCGLVLPRSGLGHREGLVLGNGTGVIDADYEGPLFVSAWNRNPAPADGETVARIVLEPGDRIAQLVVVRVAQAEFEILDDAAPGDPPVGDGARGGGGFGSSGRR
ncbi:dUTP diphosphatase [Methylobacterium haplocladii]|uniref:dUTP diphosphatase n=1 Tax=Methylobacterium haplocladii TaxID=1176176 RepID=A0A512ILJ7_9HYPH|nr:dUTP diphosphatase [Methylobacterium haplocladii]GEO98593.1 deoxyuridine 5'-triphosphate nucleotidohydrolase [Methylobacterium haplocladii]GJD84007.1 Deoxyuridine 5'-triphosphate nucleotidohydrolase [Methylobacterium haplocladii]GLS59235.1 deoxyuridine 5'-triphosphate nucleotidohydrolase [Methylobacterium haplocladii]